MNLKMSEMKRFAERLDGRNCSMKPLALVAGTIAALVLVGCNNSPWPAVATPTGTPRNVTEPVIAAEAGVELDPASVSANLPNVLDYAKGLSFGVRRDPFSMLMQEVSFDREQLAERVLSDFGGFASEFELPDEVTEAPAQFQPRPPWRLSGVVVTQGGIVGLLDMGMPTANGSAMEIRPGQRIPGTPFIVASLDQDKAVLRRTDNQLPREITIFLEAPLIPTNPGGPAGAPGGMPGPGGPGAPPPGGGRAPEDER